MEIAVAAARYSPMDVRRCAVDIAQAKDDPSVLNCIVGVVKHRPDDPDFWPYRMAYHLLKPARLDDLDIVIEQPDNLAARPLRPYVADP